MKLAAKQLQDQLHIEILGNKSMIRSIHSLLFSSNTSVFHPASRIVRVVKMWVGTGIRRLAINASSHMHFSEITELTYGFHRTGLRTNTPAFTLKPVM